MGRPLKDNRKHLYENTTMTLPEISKALGVRHQTLIQWTITNYPPEYREAKKKEAYRKSKLGSNNPMSGKIGNKHPNYKGKCSDGKGYILVLKPDWFTGRVGSKHVFEHHVVYCKEHGLTEIPDGFQIHHLDGDGTNNDPDNLIMLTASDHTRLHNYLKSITD